MIACDRIHEAVCHLLARRPLRVDGVFGQVDKLQFDGTISRCETRNNPEPWSDK
jgi:hypothetical protein